MIINKLKAIATSLFPDDHIVFSMEAMHNAIDDELAFNEKFVFIDEMYSGRVDSTYGKLVQKNVTVIFGKVVDMDNMDADDRESVREDILKNMLLPFISAVEKDNSIRLTDHDYNFENVTFTEDNPQVAIKITLYVQEALC